MQCIRAGAFHRGESAVDQERNAALCEARAEQRAVAVAKRMIEDGSNEAVHLVIMMRCLAALAPGQPPDHSSSRQVLPFDRAANGGHLVARPVARLCDKRGDNQALNASRDGRKCGAEFA
jgi:hypothetical protein